MSGWLICKYGRWFSSITLNNGRTTKVIVIDAIRENIRCSKDKYRSYTIRFKAIGSTVDRVFEEPMSTETSGFGPIPGGHGGNVFYLYCLVGSQTWKWTYRRNLCITAIGFGKTTKDLANAGSSWNYPLQHDHSRAWDMSPRFQHPGMASHSPASFTTITKAVKITIL